MDLIFGREERSMSFAINALNAYSGISSVQPMNYSMKNHSEVSSAYTESLKEPQSVGTFPGIGDVTPVSYPNAAVSSVDSTARLAKTQSTDRELNDIASGFSGIMTGYGSDRQSYGYEMIGSTIDYYA